MRSQPVRPLHAVVVMATLLAGLWVVEGLDQLSGNALDMYGIRARDVDGLSEIFTAPLLHAGWEHLASNSVPFFAFGLLVLLGGVARWVVSTLVSVTVAPGKTLPCASTTVPRTEDVPDCADVPTARMKANKSAHKNENGRLFRIFCFCIETSRIFFLVLKN